MGKLSKFSSLAHRGQEVREQVLEEMKQLCQIIQSNGKEDNGTTTITFGDLFEVKIDKYLQITFDCLPFFFTKQDLYQHFG